MDTRICPVCGSEFTPKINNQKYCTKKCTQKAYFARKKAREPPAPFKLPASLCKQVNGYTLHKALFNELERLGVIVEYLDIDSNSKYFALKPFWRREIYQLGPPEGISSYVVMDLPKKTKKTPKMWTLIERLGGEIIA